MKQIMQYGRAGRGRSNSPLVAMAALCAALLNGCGAGAGAPSGTSGELYLTGPIESIVHRATASGILVQPADRSEPACGISSRVDDDTRFFLRDPDDDALRQIQIGDLEIGDTVEVYVTGPIAESCPVQAYASTMVLVEQSR